MLAKITATTLLLLLSLAAVAAQGVVNVQSNHSVAATATRFESIATDKGLTVFNRIDHGAGAAKVGMALPPTQIILFGNPKVGTPLMQCQRTAAIDLPQKMLIWQDEAGKVWLSYNDPQYLKARHKLQGCDEVVAKITKVLSKLSKAAAN
ncbi:DUF302 domain-containing protein [Ferrimonas lipolytica]|uniref:DUF302 domain-containing protein n=2 Tax=Ferrimonas lipolytica TaxID=2724191 RepID=A0A6H1UKG8_9GAMM|nr:DUF302 domain-containing protein [Ferrimonas lipolytica]